MSTCLRSSSYGKAGWTFRFPRYGPEGEALIRARKNEWLGSRERDKSSHCHKHYTMMAPRRRP